MSRKKETVTLVRHFHLMRKRGDESAELRKGREGLIETWKRRYGRCQENKVRNEVTMIFRGGPARDKSILRERQQAGTRIEV